jgi:hypothetical protein
MVVDLDDMTAPTVDRVVVNVYDLSQAFREHWERANRNYSVYHTGVQVYGREWSFGQPRHLEDTATYVQWHEARQYPELRFRNPLDMGYTSCSPRQVLDIIDQMKLQWNRSTYNVSWNCHHFSEALCSKLGVGRLPAWVKEAEKTQRGRVVVRVYDLGQTIITRGYNALAKSYGAFHSGVEVYGKEWAFGMNPNQSATGVSWNPPGECPEHSFREMISMGCTTYTPEQVDQILNELMAEWPGVSYDIFTRNCHNFSEELCRRLGVACLPSWVNNLAPSLAPSPTERDDGGASDMNADADGEDQEVLARWRTEAAAQEGEQLYSK